MRDEEKTYIEKARENEKNARIALVHHRNRVPKLYESAGDNWIQEVKSTLKKISPSQKKRFLTFAKQDYNHALNEYGHKLNKEDLLYSERQQIFESTKNVRKKLNKLEETLNSLLPNSDSNNYSKKSYYPAIISVLSFLFALFFISSNLTGFAISNTRGNDSNILGLCFFVCGLVFTFIYFKNKK
ncbi:hypothetical protein M0R19_00165 [Candidatus Pacearchaeota archaeon]|jgi:hypothetical protein|nr:hypothetical protein [Candidatus Pacearchaeota archaeon]